MGTWGIRSFDNDSAADWLDDLTESDDLSMLEDALSPDASDYLEAPEGESILAAAEIICAIRSGPRAGLPDAALEWIGKHKHLEVAGLVPSAITLLNRVLADNSELNELWAESEDDYPVWKADVEELLNRLRA